MKNLPRLGFIVLGLIGVFGCSPGSSVTVSPATPLPRVLKVFGYAPSQYTNLVHEYSLDQTTGALTPLATDSIAAQTLPLSLAVSLSKKFLVAANYSSNSLSSYAIDGTTGNLTLVGNYPVTGQTGTAYVYAHPTKNVFYTADAGTSHITVFAMNPTTGALSVQSGIAAGSGVTAFAINSAGTILYSANQNVSEIGIYAIDGNGDLTAAGTQAMTAGSQISHLLLSPNEHFLYAGNWATATVSGFSISGTTLSPVGSDVATGAGGVYTLGISPDGQRLYAAKPYGNSFTSHSLDPVTGAIGAAVTTTLNGSVNFAFYGKYAYLVPWTSAAAGLPIDTRSYSAASGMGATALSSTAAIQGAYSLLFVEVPQ